jgi:endonuclease/exonuclease/phosphatase family metal-dependent hydrolase
VGTRVGRAALDNTLAARGLTCVTGGEPDPLRARGWRASIDHVILSAGLRSQAVEVWPEEFPLSRTLSDHHGVCIRLADA